MKERKLQRVKDARTGREVAIATRRENEEFNERGMCSRITTRRFHSFNLSYSWKKGRRGFVRIWS